MTRLSLPPLAAPAASEDGLRPVDLRKDLRPLADLIELAFSATMDDGGRSAIREMRYLSHMGVALRLITRLSPLAEGISLGFVYVSGGELVGNVSIYPASYPREFGETWLLANVAVHPKARGRGIAHQLVEASVAALQRRGAARVILQVDANNEAALTIYEAQGFRYERAWRHWRRSARMRAGIPPPHGLHITRLRRGEREAEYALALAARPNSRGGLGWLKPLHKADFCPSPWRQLRDLLALNSVEKLIIRDENSAQILASCWLENAMGFGRVQARLFTAPRIDHKLIAEALIGNLVARFERSTIQLEHPRDDDIVSELLKRQHFKLRRELWHMRLDF